MNIKQIDNEVERNTIFWWRFKAFSLCFLAYFVIHMRDKVLKFNQHRLTKCINAEKFGMKLALTWLCLVDLEKHDIRERNKYILNGKCNKNGRCEKHVPIDIIYSIEEQCIRVLGVNHDAIDGDVPTEVACMKFVDVLPPHKKWVFTLPHKKTSYARGGQNRWPWGVSPQAMNSHCSTSRSR